MIYQKNSAVSEDVVSSMSISVILLFIIIMQKNGKLNVFGGCWCMYTKTLHHLIHIFFSVTEIWFISYKSITSYAERMRYRIVSSATSFPKWLQ